MISDFSNNEIRKLIRDNESLDPFEVSLRLKNHDSKIRKYVSNQILARRKSRRKIPEWFHKEDIVFPSPISVEQASSSVAAQYKANLVKGEVVFDLTGGMGVDSYFFSQVAKEVWYFEKDPELFEIAELNFKILGSRNIKTFCQDSINFLKSNPESADCIYIDPSRRVGEKKVFRLEESEPNVIAELEMLLRKSKKVIIKASPFLDIKYAIKEVKGLSEVHVLAIENECKEILLVIANEEKLAKTITVNISENEIQEYSKKINDDTEITCNYSIEGKYLYDPNAAIRKAGLFKSICNDYKISKIAANSHLYTGENLISTFPGRIFEIIEICTFNTLLKKYKLKKANIAIRNYPISVREIREKTKIVDGGDMYIFGTTDYKGNSVFIVCNKT